MDLKITLQPKQREAIKTSESVENTLFGGAKGGGKSHSVRAKELKRRLEYPGTHGVIIRKTYDELRANHINKMFTEYPGIHKWYNKAEKTIYYPNGSTTNFKYLARTEDVFNFQGLEYEDISLDEATQHDELVYKTLGSSLRTTNPDIKPSFFLTGNPGGPGHQWVKRIFIDKVFKPDENPEDYAFVKSRVFDNQALMENDPSYLKRLQALPERLRRAYLDGDWTIFAGLGFDELDSIHIVKPFRLPDNTRYLSGYDYGFTHPFAWVLLAITPDGKIYVVDYIRKNKLRPDEQGQMIKEKLEARGISHIYIHSGTDIWSDKGSRDTIYEQLQKAVGEFATFVRAHTNREAGVAEIRNQLAWMNTKSGEPALRFFETTTEVFDNVRSMQVDSKKPEDVIKTNADEDGNGGDDLYDAFRYAVMARLYPNNPKSQKVEKNSGEELMRLVSMQRRINNA